MRIKLQSFNLLGVFFFCLFSILSISKAKAQDALTTPVEGQANTLTAAVTGVSTLPEVTVKAQGINQAKAFNQMHEAFTKVNILSQSQINQTPAKTVAQAAEQLPGVGTQHDTSEPRYIDIRGTDSNLNIITFNGTLIPSYDESNRSVDLDDIPAGLFGELQLYKTIMPNMDAQGVGGQLNLVPKYASEYPNGLFQLKAEGEYFPERNQPGTMEDLTWANNYNLGGETKLGILVDGGYQFSRFGIDDLENGYTDPANSPIVANSATDYDFRYYNYERDRAGIGTNISLDLDKNDKLYANLMYTGYDEYRRGVWENDYKNLDAIAANGDSVSPDGTININATNNGVYVKKSGTDELTQFRTLAMGVGGENNLNGFDLDYKASFAYTEQYVPWDYGYTFKTGTLSGTLTYNNSTNNGNDPSFNFSGLNGQDVNAGNFLYKGTNNSTSLYEVSSYGAKADGQFDVPLGGDDTSTVKFGADMHLDYSDNTQENFQSDLTGVPLYLSNPAFDLSYPSYYPPNNEYSMGPVPAIGAADFLNGANQYQGAFYQGDPVGDKGGDYTDWEDVYAAYAMDTFKTGNMQVMAGARLEVTHIQFNWFNAYADGPNGPYSGSELAAVIPEEGTIDYANVLPALGLKYTFSPEFLTRMNFSQTIARPTQNQYIPNFSLPQALDAQLGSNVVNLVYGNPNLKPMISNNFDSSWEFYPEKGAILACDFFLKDIANYVAQDYAVVDNSGGVTTSTTYENIPYSQIYGVEFQYQQQYTMLPGFLSGLGYRGAISFMGSEGELSPGVYGELPSQSDLVWETGVFYKKSGLTVDVAGNFTGKNLTVVGDPNASDYSPNQYYDDYFQINAKAQYAFTQDFSIYADWNNINNADLRYYQASPNYPIQNEYYGPSYDGGIEVTF